MTKKKDTQEAEFTNSQMEEIYSIINEYGGDKKVQLRRRIEALIRNDRASMAYKIQSKIKQLYLKFD